MRSPGLGSGCHKILLRHILSDVEIRSVEGGVSCDSMSQLWGCESGFSGKMREVPTTVDARSGRGHNT
jgi:hypothetical protein